MSKDIMNILIDMVDEGHFEKVVSKAELLYDRKIWNSDILVEGGISYYYPEQNPTNDLKKRYRVSCTYKDEHTKLLKYKIRTAQDEVFSVAASSQREAQAVVDELFGVRHYRVSQQMV